MSCPMSEEKKSRMNPNWKTLHAEIVAAVKGGSNVRAECKARKVGRTTFYRWAKAAAAGKSIVARAVAKVKAVAKAKKPKGKKK